MSKDIQIQIETLVIPILDDLGFELVDFQFKNEGKQWALCIFIDKPGGITLDNCAEVSREIGAILEVEDPIKSAYRIEISSPGLDRPLKKPADFERLAGQKIKLKTFAGTLLGLEEDQVRVEQNDKRGGLVVIPLAEIEKANLEEEL